jgi:hypothetical protein
MLGARRATQPATQPTMSTARKILDRLFEAEPLLHPHVEDAFDRAATVLKAHRIPFRVIGGLASVWPKTGSFDRDEPPID